MPISRLHKAWTQSLSLLSKKELLLFILSWSNTIKRALFVFLKYFWWLVALELVLRNDFFSKFPLAITSMLFLFFSSLAIRASVCNKTASYFYHQSLKLINFLPLYLIVFFFIDTVIGAKTNLLIVEGINTTSVGIINTVAQTALTGWMLIAAFFLLDGLPLVITPVKALTCAAKSILTHLPIFALASLSYNLIYYLLLQAISGFSPYLIVLIFLCYHFVFMCAIHIFYLKIRHSNYKLFFGTV